MASMKDVSPRDGDGDGAGAGEWDFIQTMVATIRKPTIEDLMAPLSPPTPSAKLAPRKSPSRNDHGFGAKAPPTPTLPPIDLQPPPLRYPETLGTLIEIRESAGKGFGIFALRDVLPGSIILSEAPLVTLIDTGTRADPLDIAIAALSPAKRAAFLSLHHYSRNPHESLHRSIVYSNGYSIHSDMATGIFETASRINHSCVPNCGYVWKEGAGRMVFWNREKVLEGEEITVDYGHKRNQLRRIYGFECMCGGCTDPGSEDISSVLSDGMESLGIDEVIGESVERTGEEGGRKNVIVESNEKATKVRT